MRCPFCGFGDTQVKDSRPSEDHIAIKRRRFCTECGSRFTTFERVQFCELVVVKRNGNKEPFKREKLARSIYTAMRKRPMDPERMEKVISSIVRNLELMGESEITSKDIGMLVMQSLKTLDHVAYVRFASVYREFTNPEDFNAFVQSLEKDLEKDNKKDI
jgi:transcriptional repressor NrdR